eukprot:Clim_evm49s136 gene=Clim_evmTU49s136
MLRILSRLSPPRLAVRQYSTGTDGKDGVNTLIRQFIFKVHPDKFGSDPIKQAVNSQSLSKWNEIMNAAASDRLHELPQHHMLKFYTSGGEGKKPVKVKLNIPPYMVSAESGRVVTVQLLEQMGLISKHKPGKAASRDGGALSELGEKRGTLKPKRVKESTHKTKEQWYLMRDELDLPRHAWEQHAHRTHELQRITKDPQLFIKEQRKKLASSQLVWFAKELSINEKRTAFKRLDAVIHHLSYDAWKDLPLLIGEDFSSDRKGWLVIDHRWANIDALKNYFKKNTVRVRQETGDFEIDLKDLKPQ